MQSHNGASHAHDAHCPFGSAVEPHLMRMFRVARRILNSDDLAWDAIQTTLLRLWRAEGVDHDHGCAVLLKVVRVVSLEVLRGQSRRRRHEEIACQASAESIPTDPAAAADLADLLDALHREIDALPAECRDAIHIRLDGEMDYQQMADELGVPVGTVRSRLHRARRLLAERLAETTAA